MVSKFAVNGSKPVLYNRTSNLFKAVSVKIFESEDVEDSDCALVLAQLVVVLPVDGHVDLLDDVDKQATVDALGERVADVTALVRVQGGHLVEKYYA